MSIETLSDIAEEVADLVGIYEQARQEFVPELIDRMRRAAEAEWKLAQPAPRGPTEAFDGGRLG